MKHTTPTSLLAAWVCSALVGAALVSGAAAQEKSQPGKPINIDRELRAKPAPDRAQSYYHFSLSKWYEENGEGPRALAEMRRAVELNDTSSPLRVELAGLLARASRLREAEEECREAARLDPKNPEPYWLLGAFIYPNLPASRERSGAQEALRKAIKELETMREIAPDDERSYFALGKAYFDAGQPDNAVQAFEKFQSLRSDTDQGYLNIARYYEKAGNTDKAIEYLEKAVKTHSENAESMLLLASLYAKTNRDKEAIPIYRKILESTGENLPIKRQLGSALVDAGQFTEAVKILEELAPQLPRDGLVLTQLGRARLGARQIPKAIESFKAALAQNPANMEAEFYLGACYESSAQPAQAAKIFAGLLERTEKPNGLYSEAERNNRSAFQQHLASAYQDMGEAAKAIALYEEIVKADPSPRQFFLLINAYRVDRQFDKAVELARHQYEKNPKDHGIVLVYARTLADAGKLGQGIDVLHRAIRLDPGNLDLHVNLSQIFVQGKKFSDAEKALRRAQTLDNLTDQDRERIKFQQASIYERQKEFDRAEALFQEILKASPDNATVLNYIGYMLADRGVRLQEAVRYVEKALEIEPNNGAFLDSLGWAFYKLNDFGKAEQYLLKAVAAVKNDPTIHEHLGDLYVKTGELEKAEDSYTKSLTHGTEPEEIQKVREKLENLKETLRKQKRR